MAAGWPVPGGPAGPPEGFERFVVGLAGVLGKHVVEDPLPAAAVLVSDPPHLPLDLVRARHSHFELEAIWHRDEP